MTSLIRRLILPPIAAASLVLALAGTAFAGTPDVTVGVFNEDGTPAGDTVCAFSFEFNPIAGGETGTWELRDASDAVVEHGDYSVTTTDGDRTPDSGTFSLDNGTYTLIWDDESPIDKSNQQLQIVVSCETNPATSPEQSLAAETSVVTQKPGGGVGNVGGGPTLPNTSAKGQATGEPSPLAALLLPALAGLLALVVVLTPRRGMPRR
jgi:hypothetical protein